MAISCTFDSLGSISFSVVPEYWPLSTWLSLAGSRHNHTVLLGLGTMMKLLCHWAILSTLGGASICCSGNLILT